VTDGRISSSDFWISGMRLQNRQVAVFGSSPIYPSRHFVGTLQAKEASQIIEASKEPRRGGDTGPGGTGTAIITRPKTQTRRPSMYRVLLLNDDYTPMEFVVTVLRKYFNKDTEEATRIMLHVHQHGVGECGIFTYEVAETKVTQVMDYARKHQHPLQCIMEKK
jgi:ATP-dependent Clp protease adaptor protein ClpS